MAPTPFPTGAGGDLRAFLNGARRPLENSVAFGLARDIAKGMQFLHSKKAIHGDLKSPNVLLNRENRAKVSAVHASRPRSKRLPDPARLNSIPRGEKGLPR